LILGQENPLSLFSYIDHLECSECQQQFSADEVQTFCPSCNAPLSAIYDLDSIKKTFSFSEFSSRPNGMWRWHELLPVKDPQKVVSLGEGDTPILPLPRIGKHLGLTQFFLKDEGTNPTHCFKARGLSAAVSKAVELGVQEFVIPTAGNAGASLASYCARVGLPAHIFMPKDTPEVNIRQCKASHADLTLVDGLINDAGALAREKTKGKNWFDVSTFKEPYRLEGKKIMGFEIAEYFQSELPDMILYPAGGGTGLVGIWKAFQELLQLGWLTDKHLPKMVAVQSTGCAPIVKAWQEGKDHCDLWQNARTIAFGLRVPKSFADRMIMRVIRESGGSAIAIDDADILKAQDLLATQEGIFACPEGAATLAALQKMMEHKEIRTDSKILLLNTGSGLLNQDLP
jgi:threonine synthase